MTPLDALRDPKLFGGYFPPTSWSAWFAFIAAVFGLPLDRDGRALYRQCTGRERQPTKPAREGWVIVGRRGGKSRIAAFLAVYLACFRNYDDVLAPGEVGTVAVIAADRRQARTIMRYITAFLDHIPLLGKMVVRRTADSVEFEHRVVIEVHTASVRSIRGYTIIGAILDELAFWWTDETSANPDTEILNGLRPGMATVKGALLLCISSPYARKGALWEAYRRHHGREDDPVLVWQAPTATMNPTIDGDVIAAAYEQDEAAARAEFGGEFRADVEAYLTVELVEAATIAGRDTLERDHRHDYVAFCDPAGGSGGDSMTLAIAHTETHGIPAPVTNGYPFAAIDPVLREVGGDVREVVVIDYLAEVRPPFSPAEAVREFAAALARYGVAEVVGDRYAGAWPSERFSEHGITYTPAPDTKAGLYLTMLPAFTAREIELPDHPRLTRQLIALERRTSRAGRDIVDHPPRGHDDLANAVAGAVALARAERGAWWEEEEAFGI